MGEFIGSGSGWVGNHGTGSAPSVAVGIATLDRYPYVERLLDDLAGQTRLPDEVLIVDQTDAVNRRSIAVERWSKAFPVRVIVQNARGTTKARNLILRHCHSDVILQPDDDSRVDPDYVSNHARHFDDSRVDVVSGPVYEWDSSRREWYVKWKNHLLLAGPDGPAFVSSHSYSGGNSSVRVASALAIGGWDENILTHGEDEDFADRLHHAGAVVVYDPQTRLFHLRAPRGGERANEWGTGPEGNWRVLAGFLYYYLANRPAYDALAQSIAFMMRPFWHIKHGRPGVGLRLLPRVALAIPASHWRWIRGRLLVDASLPDRHVRRFSKREVAQQAWTLAEKCPRTVLLDRSPPELLT